MARRLVLLLALPLGLVACRDWRERVDPSRAAAEPVQQEVGGDPIEFERKGFRVRLTPRAIYRITGYAAETSRLLLDEWDFVSPLDVALVWGPVADPEALRRMRFHLSRRYVSWFWEGDLPPRIRQALPSHVANNHLIPAGEEVARELDRIRVGDLVTLAGRLVDIEIRDASGRVVRRSPTSLSRFDTGSGACEQIWVESAEVERP